MVEHVWRIFVECQFGMLRLLSDQRDEGASGLLVWRREEHGHAGGAAGPRHPHLKPSARLHLGAVMPHSFFSSRPFFFSLSFDCLLFCYHLWSWPTWGSLQVNSWLWHHYPLFEQEDIDSNGNKNNKPSQALQSFVRLLIWNVLFEKFDSFISPFARWRPLRWKFVLHKYEWKRALCWQELGSVFWVGARRMVYRWSRGELKEWLEQVNFSHLWGFNWQDGDAELWLIEYWTFKWCKIKNKQKTSVLLQSCVKELRRKLLCDMKSNILWNF